MKSMKRMVLRPALILRSFAPNIFQLQFHQLLNTIKRENVVMFGTMDRVSVWRLSIKLLTCEVFVDLIISVRMKPQICSAQSINS